MKEASRTALLIGVGDIPAAAHRFRPLKDAVTADLRELTAALRGAGYQVEILRDPSRNKITERITEISTHAPTGSTLLLHFTGHGVRIGDTDYLVPADARAPLDDNPAAWEQPHIRESLLDADISKYLTCCSAGTVLWLIDACRSPEDGGATAFGSNVTKGPPSGGFAVMSGCAPGQRSGYSGTGSFFTLALAEAFDPLTEATTVEDVYQTARRLTRQLALRRGAEPQDVRIHYGTDLEQETRALVVARGRRLLESWREVVREPALWERVPESDADNVPRFQECLITLASEAARQVHRAQERLPDPWADDDFPVRLLRDRLPRLLAKDAELSALEVTSLIAGVFLHEAAWASRLSQAAEVTPHSVHHQDDGNDQRRHYEQIVEHHPQIAEKLSGRLWWRDDPAHELEAVTLWLVHRWIAERFETDEQAVPPAVADGFAAQLLNAGAPSRDGRTNGRAAELSTALRTVAGGLALGSPPDDQQLSFPDRYSVSDKPQRLRVRPLAALLHLAALLAFDTRTLPEVLAEHLAVSDPVLPREVIAVLRDAFWNAEDDGTTAEDLHLDAVCPHPAVHAALGTIVEDADELGYALMETARRLPAPEAALLKALPARVTDRRLRPHEDRGRRAYDVPLLRFSLAQTEVRRLLMGEKLYDGEPALAVRELYQNAMDACRYRQMRTRYLRGRGKQPAPWAGNIHIETGSDTRGRYVECRDNGVGMTVDQLKNTFTRAGRRFEQSRDFRREQAGWLRQDSSLRLYPNSRFGIGVFSYFMLADEMTIVTRPVDVHGIPARKALRVDIPGSGSLFRVQEDDGQSGEVLPEGGTRVRLYLRDTNTLSGASCESVLRALVLISEFRLEVRSESGRERVWLPGILQTGTGQLKIAADTAIEAVPGTLWWVKGNGAILCDGIANNERPFGYVLNLTGPHAGELSVNRKKLENYDVQWARQQWRLGARALATWSELDLAWLHELESYNLSAARVIWQKWSGKGLGVKADYSKTVDLDAVGWFRLDELVGDEESDTNEERAVQDAVQPWRSAALGSAYRTPGKEAGPLSLAGHPVPQPGWADIATEIRRDWRSVISLAHDQQITVAEALRVARGLRIVHPRLAGPAVFDGDLDWTPTYIDARIMRGLLGPEQSWQFRTENNYRHAPGDLSGIVRASADSAQSLGELAAACGRYAPLVRQSLGEVPGYHRDHVCDDSDLVLLYVQEDGGSWRPTSRPWDIPGVADRLSITPLTALKHISQFAWLGQQAPDATLVARWADAPGDLLPILLRYVDDAKGRPLLPWAATIALASEWKIPLRKAEKILARAAEHLGLAHQRRYTSGSAGHDFVPEPGMASLVTHLHSAGLRLEAGVSLRDLTFTRSYQTEREELAQSVNDLRTAGVDAPDAANLLRAWEELPMASRYAFSGQNASIDATDYPALPTSDVLFTASQQLREKLSFTWKTTRKEVRRLGLGPEFSSPVLADELKEYRPTRDETEVLIEWDYDEYGWMKSPRWTPLTAERLIGYACAKYVSTRKAFELLQPLRAIGALVPELTMAAVAGLPDSMPGLHDKVALDPEYRVSGPGESLVPLDLVSIAGRLGESIARTWQRITPYLALEPAPSLITVASDVLPLWQDLAILSERLDGMLPAIAGRITPERLAFAAAGVGESTEWVRERLGLYAEMFGLELPPVDEDNDHS
ncbi:caspase family protein [Streptomyces sp. NPDC059743]|uniref:HD domain-containing protein n=1 Tax=Streptomyces sp. NPDC059743 TaxID=3346928 RepID=UPI00364C260E